MEVATEYPDSIAKATYKKLLFRYPAIFCVIAVRFYLFIVISDGVPGTVISKRAIYSLHTDCFHSASSHRQQTYREADEQFQQEAGTLKRTAPKILRTIVIHTSTRSTNLLDKLAQTTILNRDHADTRLTLETTQSSLQST